MDIARGARRERAGDGYRLSRYTSGVLPPNQIEDGNKPKRRTGSLRLPLKIVAVSWKDLAETLGPILLLALLAIALTAYLVRPAPPHTLTIATGPAGSNFERVALLYQKILARSGVKLKVIESEGSLQNLGWLVDPKSGVDIALVQSGVPVPGSEGAVAAGITTIPNVRVAPGRKSTAMHTAASGRAAPAPAGPAAPAGTGASGSAPASAGGQATGPDTSNMVSLGSVFYQPLTIFYRSPQPIERLSQLAGRRIAIGPAGSGTQILALALLKGNEIEPNGATDLLSMEGDDAKTALLGKTIDAIFLSGDSASTTTIREMLHAEGIRLFNFVQADAYVRRYHYLSKLELPPGSLDLGENLPPTPVNWLSPTVELIGHADLHPALCDLLLEAAFEVHSHGTLLQATGQFPNATTSAFPISDEASRYYKTGNKSFLYRFLPFWLASLLNRALVIIVPILVVIIPGLRVLPQLYSWRVNSRIHRRYGELMALERESLGHLTDERRLALLERLNEIERVVIRTRMPGSHAEQIYILREHIGFVRGNLTRSAAAAHEHEHG